MSIARNVLGKLKINNKKNEKKYNDIDDSDNWIFLLRAG